MTIILTGATGFVGKSVTKLPQNFRCVVRLNEKHTFSDSYTVDSIDYSTEWNGCFQGVDSIIHLAGLAHSVSYTDDEYRTVNTLGTLRLAEKAVETGVKRFVFVSSIGVNGGSSKDSPFVPSDVVKPHNAYSLSKYDAELGLWDLAQKTGLEVVIVRPTLVYGPGAPGNFGALTKLVCKVPVLPFGLSKNRRDFIAVQNLADLLVTCAKHPNAAGHTFLASDFETASIKEFTNAIGEGLGKKVVQLPIPVSLMRFVGKVTGKSAMIEQLYGNLQVDSSNIKEILGWSPPLTMKQAMASLHNSSK
ncbi:UDP-glucose 4-epimerase [Vibrio breoganii]|uniref:NAD-dependent epimerase/dehydratase family protein n=1 Tax=Vibrio breoganii TaxID=553239 RepID=UPI000C837F37|nr:NAD-dependent epimerase/dehydratase family protein [Vibrio breoganii]PMM14353.1 UDP-glucose 4-epimerase [Vibrio breoganii]